MERVVRGREGSSADHGRLSSDRRRRAAKAKAVSKHQKGQEGPETVFLPRPPVLLFLRAIPRTTR